MKERLTQWFLTSCAVILTVTALAKFISVTDEVKVLAWPDPVFEFLTFRQLFFLTGALELAVASILLFSRVNIATKLAAVLWISATFLTYRIGLWAIGYKGECNCLGHLTDWLGLAPGIVDAGMKTILAYLLLGSIAFIVNRRIGVKIPIPPTS